MPAVFVHGVPDTASMWQPLIAALGRSDVIAVGLPGFATRTPAGWDATKESDAAWLEAEIEALGEPVDLVGHDWGAILAQRVASTRPDLIRTFACGSGPLDATYSWHTMAQLWQTPEVGEQVMVGLLGMATGGRRDAGPAGPRLPRTRRPVQSRRDRRTPRHPDRCRTHHLPGLWPLVAP